MVAKVYPIEDGYAIRGIAPPELALRSQHEKLLFHSWVLEFGLKAKDRELSQGLDKDGKPLRRISLETRRHRRSAMTPTGKGDPSAPPLEPGRALSRTRSLLTGHAYEDHVDWWWKFDPFTGASWARVLDIQADHGRDVFGLSPKALKRVQAQAWERWRAYLAGKAVPGAMQIAIPQAPDFIPFSGGKSKAEWEAHFRQPATVAIPARGTKGNVLLRHIYGDQAPPKPIAIVPKPPKPKPIAVQRVAMAQVPAPVLRGQALIDRSTAILEGMSVPTKTMGLAAMKAELPRKLVDAGTPALFDDNTGIVYINRDNEYWSHPERTMRKFRKAKWLSTYTYEHVPIHEGVHAKHLDSLAAALGSREPAIVRYRELIRMTFPEAVQERVRKEVGRYAAIAPGEFVAEVGAALAEGRAFSEWVMELYRQYLGPLIARIRR